MSMQSSSPVKHNIFDHTPDSLAELLLELGMKKFRAKQILSWVYEKKIIDPEKMSNLSQSDRKTLAGHFDFSLSQKIRHQQATDGVQKLLLQWLDLKDDKRQSPILSLPVVPSNGHIDEDPSLQTECVMIPVENRATACISSQVGCPVKCNFCASGLGGLDGNLSAGQIVEQVWQLSTLPDVQRISNVVFMGMGEPLSNYGEVTKAIETLTADWGMGISARKITVSTVGLPAQIKRLSTFGVPVTLALSLHAPNDKLRRELIPWADYVSIEQLIDACDTYFSATGREITLEYILLSKVNDQQEHARELSRLCARLRCNVNLIRYNEVEGIPYQRPETDDVIAFQNLLRKEGVNVHIRASRGRDIAAACGQLRHECK